MIHISNFHLREIERRRSVRRRRSGEIAKERPLLFKILKFNSFVFVPASIPRRDGPHAAHAHSNPYKYVWRHYFAYKCACWTSIQLDVFNKCVVGAKIDDCDRSVRSTRAVSLSGALVRLFRYFFPLLLPASPRWTEGKGRVAYFLSPVPSIEFFQRKKRGKCARNISILLKCISCDFYLSENTRTISISWLDSIAFHIKVDFQWDCRDSIVLVGANAIQFGVVAGSGLKPANGAELVSDSHTHLRAPDTAST